MAQSDPKWASHPFGRTELSGAPGTMRDYGCSVSALSMLFNVYGIHSTPFGSPDDPTNAENLEGLRGEPLTPGSLNKAFANYTKENQPTSKGTVALTSSNSPHWIGAAEVGRAGYVAQCNATQSCDPNEYLGSVSFKDMVRRFGDAERKLVNEEICKGNPVILRLQKANTTNKYHFVLATATDVDAFGEGAYIMQDPGSTENGRNRAYRDIRDNYPNIIGYTRYVSARDPAMLYVTSSLNIEFLITDPQGRRVGYNPNTQTEYEEIPGAVYYTESINTPNEEGYEDKTLVSERTLISSQDALAGEYTIQVFSTSGGEYYLYASSHDINGMQNGVELFEGNLTSGEASEIKLQKSNDPLDELNADLKISKYKTVRHKVLKRLTGLSMKGQITSKTDVSLGLTSSFHLKIGDESGYNLYIPANDFKKRNIGKKKKLYTYKKKFTLVTIDSEGNFTIRLTGSDLKMLNEQQFEKIELKVDSLHGKTEVDLKCRSGSCSLKPYKVHLPLHKLNKKLKNLKSKLKSGHDNYHKKEKKGR